MAFTFCKLCMKESNHCYDIIINLFIVIVIDIIIIIIFQRSESLLHVVLEVAVQILGGLHRGRVIEVALAAVTQTTKIISD